MNITYSCPGCERTTRADFSDETLEITCLFCAHEVVLPEDAISSGDIRRCLVCPSHELYKRKNFPQRIGVSITIVGFVLSCIPWYYHMWYATFAILFATALLDAALYLFTNDLLQCYRCHAQYREVAIVADHHDFDLEVHEKYRQEVARLKQHESQTQRESVAEKTTD